MQVDNSSLSSASSMECAKANGYLFGGAAAVVSCVVAHRIIGPLVALGFLGSAGYHGLRLNYHWRHSRATDANGELISGTELNQLAKDHEKNYSNRDAKFTAEDLGRLKHELQRIKSLNVALKSLKWARGFAICSLEGPFSAFRSEMGMGGSVELPTSYIGWDGYPPEQMLEYHISRLTSPIKDK
jgi:hypothetical protein